VFNTAGIENSLILAGCDPAATLFEEPLFEAGIRMLPWLCNSSEALELVRLGHAHVAGFHMRRARTSESNMEFARSVFRRNEAALINFIEWQQGFVVGAGNPKKIKSIEDLVRPDVCIVNREAGSGARLLLDDLLLNAGIPIERLRGYDDSVKSHVAVARRVLEGKADCGVCIGSAANLLGLAFVPLVEEHYDFIVKTELLNSKQLQTFFEVLNRRTVQQTLRNLCGYEARSSGKVTPV
jgi:putative molybdopterin biosynthesis protein